MKYMGVHHSDQRKLINKLFIHRDLVNKKTILYHCMTFFPLVNIWYVFLL